MRKQSGGLDVVQSAALMTKLIMEKGGEYLNDTFGIDFDLPLSAEITWGPSWGEQTEKLI